MQQRLSSSLGAAPEAEESLVLLYHFVLILLKKKNK
jgi:hypothetical protein